ncbi:MAG: ArnT family glycosyltransferase [Saprospiraceae bacterium]
MAKKKSSSKKPEFTPRPKSKAVAKAPLINPNYIYGGLLVLVALAVILIRLNFISIPFERDEGDYCYAGELLLAGETPYLDFYEQKPPGLFYSYALLLGIFGKSLEAVHLTFLLLNLITVWFLFLVGKELFDTQTGVVIGASYAFLSLTKAASGFTVQAEHLLTLCFAIAFYYLLRAFKEEKNWQFILSGAVVSWSFLIKQNGIFFIAFLGITLLSYYILEAKPISWEKVFKKAGLFAAGVLLPVVVMLGLMVALGAFDEFLFWIYEYPKEYVSSIPFDVGIGFLKTKIGQISGNYKAFWGLAVIGLLLGSFTKISTYKKVMLWSLAFFSFLAITPGLRFYGHYFIKVFPAAAILIGVSVYAVSDLLKSSFGFKQAHWGVLGLFIFLPIQNMIENKSYYFDTNPTQILREVYGTNPFAESKVIGDYLKNSSKPGDELVVLGSEPQINFYAGLKCPSRHTFLVFLMTEHPKASQWQQELKADIEQAQPRYMAMVNHRFSWVMRPNSDQMIYNWSRNYISQYYKVIGYADIFRDRPTNYVWDAAALTYQPQSQEYIAIFERK